MSEGGAWEENFKSGKRDGGLIVGNGLIELGNVKGSRWELIDGLRKK